MKNEEDVRALKAVRTMFSRKGIDISRADVRVQKGVCYIRGFVVANAASNIKDLNTELEHIAHILRTRSDIRSVVLEVTSR